MIGIPIANLPANFQQAVKMTRLLGMAYLDPLPLHHSIRCPGLEHEASKMGDVYLTAPHPPPPLKKQPPWFDTNPRVTYAPTPAWAPEIWLCVAENYTARKLANEKDKLPALQV
jgi:hypothetical protein